MKRRVWAAVVLLGIAVFAGGASADAAGPPQSLEVSGSRLTLQGQGTRSKLFFIDPTRWRCICRVHPRGWAHLGRESTESPSRRDPVPRIAARQDSSVVEGRIVAGPHVRAEGRARASLRDLNTGDTIRITYAPDSGTRILVGDTVVLTDQGDALMRAFLDLWVGRSPVSKELRGSLLGD